MLTASSRASLVLSSSRRSCPPPGPRVSAQVPTAADAPKYVLPPKTIVDVFDAEFAAADHGQPEPAGRGADQGAGVSDHRRTRRSRCCGSPASRVNPKTNGPHRASGLPGTGIYSITLKKIADGAEVER